MARDELSGFEISEEVREKLKDKAYLRRQFAKGKTAQDIMGFSDETMEKFYHAARELFEHDKYEDAANAYLFLVTINPFHSEYWIGLGMSAQMSGKYEEAVDAYELAAYYQLENPIPYFYLAKCFFALHDHDNALEALNLAIEYSGDQSQYAEIKQLALASKKLLEENHVD